ncbi:LuxR C-terminal-related transcriptional regulator [Streptomyces sp. NPDC001100]
MTLTEGQTALLPAGRAPRATDRPVHLVVLDEDPILRAGIRAILDSFSRIEITADFASVRQAFAQPLRARPDVLLIGADCLQDRSGASLTEQFLPGASPALVILMQPDDAVTLRRAVKYAVRGFVDRNTSQRDLGTAVLEAHEGRTYLSASIAEVLVGWTADGLRREHLSLPQVEDVLTERELEVLEALGHGVTNTVIAHRLHVQEATVRSHVYHILTKLNLRTRTEAVLLGHSYANTRPTLRPPG